MVDEQKNEDQEVQDSERINAEEHLDKGKVPDPPEEEEEMPSEFPVASSKPYPVNRDAIDEVL